MNKGDQQRKRQYPKDRASNDKRTAENKKQKAEAASPRGRISYSRNCERLQVNRALDHEAKT